MNLVQKQTAARDWFRSLRDQICGEFEKVEQEYQGAGKSGKFVRTPWNHPQSGGGEISLMKGRVFEKVGVNISVVEGAFSEQFRKEIPGAANNPRFLGRRYFAGCPYAITACACRAYEHAHDLCRRGRPYLVWWRWRSEPHGAQ